MAIVNVKSEIAGNVWKIQLKPGDKADLDLLKALRAFSLEARDAVESVAITRAAAIRAATPQARLQAETKLDLEVRKLLTLAEASPVLRNSVVFAELCAQIDQNQMHILAARSQSAALASATPCAPNAPAPMASAADRQARIAIMRLLRRRG